MPQVYPNGIGGSLGDSLVTCKPLLTSGNVWYVAGSSGVDAASPAGRQREQPLATLAQAHTNAAAGDKIVLLSTYDETITAVQTLNKAGITIVGEGLSGGLPTAKLRIDSGVNASLLNVTAAGVKLRGILFEETVTTNLGQRIAWSGASGEVLGCYFKCGSRDLGTGIGLTTGANNFLLKSTTFVSVATSGNRPATAFSVGLAVSDLDILDCVFDAGQIGFGGTGGNEIALDLSAAAVTRLRIFGLSLLRGADYSINAATTGDVNPQTTTGGSRGAW